MFKKLFDGMLGLHKQGFAATEKTQDLITANVELTGNIIDYLDNVKKVSENEKRIDEKARQMHAKNGLPVETNTEIIKNYLSGKKRADEYYFFSEIYRGK